MTLKNEWRNKSHQDKLLSNLEHLSFFLFFSQKLGNTDSYKVPIERLYVSERDTKCPSFKNKVGQRCFFFVSTGVTETGGGGIHI